MADVIDSNGRFEDLVNYDHFGDSQVGRMDLTKVNFIE